MVDVADSPPSAAQAVLDFWFGSGAENAEEVMAMAQRWFRGGAALDQEVTQRFGSLVEAALRGELDDWARTPRGRVALVLVLDQFTRHVFRGDPRSHAGDARAQRLALEAFDRGLDQGLAFPEKTFLAMPLLHAEDLGLQERLATILEGFGADVPTPYGPMHEAQVEQSEKYREVIRRFGRFPHRNEILGRPSTPEELEFLRDWHEKMPPREARSTPS